MALDAAKLTALFGEIAKTVGDAGVELQNLKEAKPDDAFITDLVDVSKEAGVQIKEQDYTRIRSGLALALNVIGLISQHQDDPATLGHNLMGVLFPGA